MVTWNGAHLLGPCLTSLAAQTIPLRVLVVDNALSHPAEIEPVRELLERDGRLSVTTIPVGKGELVALRR